MEHVINIARDFSPFPGGRCPDDGEYSGQEFRDNLLYPKLKAGYVVRVQLDGTRGYGSSFLEETFGGLVRKGLDRDIILKNLILETKRESLEREIKQYINDASAEEIG